MRGSPRQIQKWSRQLLDGHDFPGATLQGFAGILASCNIKSYSPNQVILVEDAVGEDMFILLEGAIAVLKRNYQGEDQHLVDMTGATVFGHMSLADRSARSATCKAIGDVTLACMTRDTYNNLMTSPTMGTVFRRLMLATLTRQLVMGSEKLADMLTPAGKPKIPTPAPTQSNLFNTEPLGENDDITQDDILDLAGVTMGWKLSTRGVDDVQLVVTEDDIRRGFKQEQ